jgi:hypothetical protein
MLVTAGGLAADGRSWIEPKHPKFLVPDPALSPIFRAKVCAGLKKAGLLSKAPSSVWKKNWVVHSQHAGRGDKVLDYLGRYVFRIAIANSRIESIADGMVRFHYRDNRSQQLRHVTLTGVEFLLRFFQHVLPRGVMKVGHYGILSPSSKAKLERARQLLPAQPTVATPLANPHADGKAEESSNNASSLPSPTCPRCHSRTLVLIGRLERSRSP